MTPLTAAAVMAEREACAKLADNGMLVPPDGGSPTEDESRVARRIAAAIRARPAPVVEPAGGRLSADNVALRAALADLQRAEG